MFQIVHSFPLDQLWGTVNMCDPWHRDATKSNVSSLEVGIYAYLPDFSDVRESLEMQGQSGPVLGKQRVVRPRLICRFGNLTYLAGYGYLSKLWKPTA